MLNYSNFRALTGTVYASQALAFHRVLVEGHIFHLQWLDREHFHLLDLN
jgi:hypothetical protein